MGELERQAGRLVGQPHNLPALPGTETPAEAAVLEALAAEMLATGEARRVVVWETGHARARVYEGEWIADCPRKGCANAEFVTEKPNRLRGIAGFTGVPRAGFVCSNCGYATRAIEWPPDAAEIMAVLDRRPVPQNRNWFPRGHWLAVAHRLPDGQTVPELLAENHEHGVF